jgi:hypothetical protein
MYRILLVIALGICFLGGLPVAEAKGKKNQLVLRVSTDAFMDFDSTIGGTTALGGAAFYVGGDICHELALGDVCTPIGKFHCWGWLIGPDQLVGPVSQEYDLFDRGKIQVQGIEDEGPRAIVGGTGDFRKVSGEATGFDLSQFGDTGEFIATFLLEGVRRQGKKHDN